MRLRIFSLFLLLPAVVFAQQASTTSMPGMDHSGVKMISGKQHPELIPDVTAYRLYFVMLGEMPNPSTNTLARQKAHIAKAHLKQEDGDALLKDINAFKVKWANMVADYNTKVDTAARLGTAPPDGVAFLAQRDQLVMATVEEIKGHLSADGVMRFQSHIQNEKSHMQITAPPEGQ